MEHRWGNRICLVRPVRVRSRHALVGAALLCDISVSGALLRTAAPFGLHSWIEVELFPFRARFQPVEATVVRIAPDGLGVEWLELAPLSVRHVLNELVQDRLGANQGVGRVSLARPERAR
jgi:hypothetical protein